MESSAAVTFPDTFLFSGDFYVTRSGNVYCNDTSDNLNMCSNNTMMSISKENGTCTEEVAFSSKFCTIKTLITYTIQFVDVQYACWHFSKLKKT